MRDQSSETRVLLTYNMRLHQSDKNMNSAAQPTGSSLDPETLNQLILTIRKFVDERLIPLEAEVSENDAIPEDVVQEMRELGLFGLTIPQEFGGIGLNTYEECKVVMELGRTSPAFRSIFGTNNGIGSQGSCFPNLIRVKREVLAQYRQGACTAGRF